MIATCGQCNNEMEHLGTFKITLHRDQANGFTSESLSSADVFRCRQCLRMVIWQ